MASDPITRPQGHEILRKLANLIDFRFLDVYVQNKYKFDFKIWQMVEKIKTDVDGLLVWKMKESSIL